MSQPFESLLIRHPKSPLFAGLSGTANLRLGQLSTPRHCAAGEILVREGAEDPYLYIIRHGRVRVQKTTSGGDSAHTLQELGPGETFGEMKLTDPGPASATVIAIEPTEVMRVDLERLRSEPDEEGLRIALLSNIARILTSRLRGTSTKTVDAMEAELQQSRLRESAGHFIVYLFAIMSGFAFVVAWLQELGTHRPRQALLSACLIIGAATPVAIMLRRSPHDRAAYGLTLQRWPRVLAESVLYTLPILVLITLAKLAWMMQSPEHRALGLFHPITALHSAGAWARWLGLVSTYSLLTVLQEFFTRSGLQASLQLFAGRRGDRSEDRISWSAIISANLMFASAHAYLGLRFMLAAFVPGLFWGWMFERQRSLLGVSVSHALVGVWALFIVGMQVLVGGQ